MFSFGKSTPDAPLSAIKALQKSHYSLGSLPETICVPASPGHDAVDARPAVWIAGADRWSEDKWRDLEDQVGPQPADTDDTHANIEAGRLARPNPPSTKRQSDWLGPRGKWF
jgi:hypothetical protein